MRRNHRKEAALEARRCAIYTRKSTAKGLEQEFNSLEAQREACEQYARSQGWRLLSERYDDGGFTGANLERPGFQRLLEDVDARKIDVVVVYKVDRLSRSLLDFARVMERFSRAGAAFVSVTQNFSTADAMGRLTLNMLMSFSEFERSIIAERTRDKIAASRRRGKWTGGNPPLGYDARDGRLVVNAPEAQVVREVFNLYEQHRSALAVSRLLNERGYTTKEHLSKRGNLKKGRPWTKNQVLHTLRLPLYAGYMRCGDELHEGEQDVIVDRQRWKDVQALLAEQSRKRPSAARNPAYLLRGVLRCACGAAMVPATSRRKAKEYRYYRCSTRDKQGANACAQRALPAEAIEDFVVSRLRHVTEDPGLCEAVSAALDERLNARRTSLERERAALPQEIAQLGADGAKAASDLAQLEGNARRFRQREVDELAHRLAAAEGRLIEVEQALDAMPDLAEEARWVRDSLAAFGGVWEAMSLENRSRLVRAVVRRVTVDERAGTIEAALVSLGGEEAKEAA